MKKMFMVVLMILMLAGIASAELLKWDASTGNVDGYVVYYGTKTGVYPFSEDVGNVLAVGVENQDGALAEHFKLNPGTWYFIVRAYNIAGESGDSNTAALVIEGHIPPDDAYPIKIVVPSTTTITITRSEEQPDE